MPTLRTSELRDPLAAISSGLRRVRVGGQWLFAAGIVLGNNACGGDGGAEDDGSAEVATAASAEAEAEAGASGSEANSEDEATSDAETTATSNSSEMTNGGWLGMDFPTGPCSASSDCTVWMEDDCPQGQKCTSLQCENDTPGRFDSNGCVDVMGDRMPGEACEASGGFGSGLDDCAEGAICLGVDPDTSMGRCAAFCEGSPATPECAPDFACIALSDGVLSLCQPTCDPLSPQCATGETCVPTNLSPAPGFVCVAPQVFDPAAYGEACDGINACGPGHLCTLATKVPEPGCDQVSRCCSPVCDVTQPNMCPGAGQVCEAYYDPGDAPLGYENVGVCAVPQP